MVIVYFEMAGDLPKRSSSGRKQWNLQDGSRNQLRTLRNQLANDGCSESQVVLAKQLLDGSQHYQSHAEKKENESLGVYWLIKASQQGNEEATKLLKTCLKTGKGISEHNFLDVKSCIEMSQNEKITRKAAREIFANLSNGRDFITTDQLQKEILSIEKKNDNYPTSLENGDVKKEQLVRNDEDSSSDSETDWTIRLESKTSSVKLTEDNLVAAAIDYSQGNLPLVTKSLDLAVPSLQVLEEVPYVYQSVLHPWLVLKKFYHQILNFFCSKLNAFYLKSDVLLIILLVSFYNVNSYVYIIPIILYYLSFILMMLSTFQMLKNQREFREYRLWSRLFLGYAGGDLNADQAEQQYLKNNLKPFGHFFLAVLVNLFIFSTISEQWIPDSELTIISFVLTLLTLFNFMPQNRITILLSFAVNLLAKYPYEKDPILTKSWQFFDLKLPIISGFTLNCIEFCTNFKPVLYFLILFLLIHLGSKENWRGTYKFLIPHCVTLSWLQMCIIGSEGSTMYGLLRGVLGLVGFVFFVPLVGLTTVLAPAFALTKWLITSSFVYSICMFFLLTCIIFFLSFHLARSSFRKYTAVLQIMVMIVSLVSLINKNPKIDFITEEESKYLPWEVFRKFCYEPSWEDENIALSQLNCAGLDNSKIFWDGYIHSIKIKTISNTFENVLKNLPESLNDNIRCIFGEEISSSMCEKLQKNNDECQILYRMKKAARKCTLEKYDLYTFEITMKMSVGIWGKRPEKLILVLDDHFRNFTMKLKTGDHIYFKGKLFNNEKVGADGILGGYKPHILLNEIGCHICFHNNLEKVTKTEISLDIFHHLFVGVKFILNTLVNPIYIFE